MAVVTLKYIRDKGQIKANLRYLTHRSGRDHEKRTRAIFTNVGQTDKQKFYRQVRDAARGTVFFKFMISPDPKREDSGKDLDLPYITRRTIRKLEQAIGRRLYFVAAVHNADHTPIRHVHGIFLVKGRLSREHFKLLQEVARAESTRKALLQRQARDLIRTSPRYQVLSRIRREIIRGWGGGRVAKVQPGCRNCGFGEFSGIPGNRTHCPLRHAMSARLIGGQNDTGWTASRVFGRCSRDRQCRHVNARRGRVRDPLQCHQCDVRRLCG